MTQLTNSVKDVIMFHANCTDGIFAAYAHYLSENSNKDTIYMPVSYSNTNDEDPTKVADKLLENITDISERDIYILDFSFPPEVMLALASKAKSVLILDHHLSASDVYAKYYKTPAINGVLQLDISSNASVLFDMTRSGAIMAFNCFNPEMKVPMDFKWVQDRDLWQFKYGDTKAFAAGIRNAVSGLSFNNVGDFTKLHNIISFSLRQVVESGRLLVQERDNRVAREKSNGYKLVWVNGYKVAFINAPADIASELGNSILSDGNVSIAVMYIVAPGRSSNSREDVPHVLCSNRSLDQVDSLFFAKHFGGGGHAQANGCSITLEQLNEFLTKGGNHKLK